MGILEDGLDALGGFLRKTTGQQTTALNILGGGYFRRYRCVRTNTPATGYQGST